MQTQQTILLSTISNKFKQCFISYKTSKLWFISLYSLCQKIEPMHINFDIDKNQYKQLLNIMNYIAADLLVIYQRSIPEQGYKLLTLIRNILKLSTISNMPNNNTNVNNNNNMDNVPHWLYYSQINFLNILGLLCLKHHQYYPALQCYQYIYKQLQQQKYDTINDIFLVSINNYIQFIKCNNTMFAIKYRINQVLIVLKQLYKRLLDKYMVIGCRMQSLQIMLAIYKQNYWYFGEMYQQQNRLLIKKVQQISYNNNNANTSSIASLSTINHQPKKFDYYTKYKQNKVTQITIKSKQLQFLTSSILSLQHISQRKSVQLKRQKQSQSLMLYNTISNNTSTNNINNISIRNSRHTHNKSTNSNYNDNILNYRSMDLSEIKPQFSRHMLKPKIKLQSKIFDIQQKPTQIVLNNSNIVEDARENIMRRTITNKNKLSSRSGKRNNSIINNNSNIQQQLQQKIQKKLQQKIIHQQPHIRIYNKNQQLTIKTNYTIIQIVKDGVIFSNFLRDKQNFLTWVQVFRLLRNFSFVHILMQYMPICCFFDLARILSIYVHKTINNQISSIITQQPRQLTQINIHLHIYSDQSKYIKLFIMNQYDINHKQLIIQSYLQQYDKYFNIEYVNQYIQYINNKIFNKIYIDGSKMLFGLQKYTISNNNKNNKKNSKNNNNNNNNNSSSNKNKNKYQQFNLKQQLSKLINVQLLCDVPSIKSSLFKMLLCMKNNMQLVVYLKQKDIRIDKQINMYSTTSPNSSNIPSQNLQQKTKKPINIFQQNIAYQTHIPLTIINLYDINQQDYKLRIPLYKIMHYFPINNHDYQIWMKKYGKYIIQSYINTFIDFPTSFFNYQYFGVCTYVYQMELVAAGKYKTPIVAEVIGSESRIWGICIRLYELALVRQNVTFIYNPYIDLLDPMVKLDPSERKQILKQNLYKGSVQQTFALLQQKKLIGTMVHIFTYWDLIQF